MPTTIGARPPNQAAAPRILLIDDEPRIRNFVSRALSASGYQIDLADGGVAGLRRALAGDYHLVILDLVMPDMDGTSVLRRLLRDRPDQPVLVLSCLDNVTTKVACLELGAQDYLAKPFSLDELLARVRVRLRAGLHSAEILRVGSLVLDLWRLQADAGTGPVPLTRLEFMLLRELMDRAGEPVPKEELLATVWGLEFDPGSNVVDVCVRRIRSKLGYALIKTVRGGGYQLVS